MIRSHDAQVLPLSQDSESPGSSTVAVTGQSQLPVDTPLSVIRALQKTSGQNLRSDSFRFPAEWLAPDRLTQMQIMLYFQQVTLQSCPISLGNIPPCSPSTVLLGGIFNFSQTHTTQILNGCQTIKGMIPLRKCGKMPGDGFWKAHRFQGLLARSGCSNLDGKFPAEHDHDSNPIESAVDDRVLRGLKLRTTSFQAGGSHS